MKLRCKFCKEFFLPTEEEIDLHDDGYCDWPEYCDDCWPMINSQNHEPDNFSDADPGL